MRYYNGKYHRCYSVQNMFSTVCIFYGVFAFVLCMYCSFVMSDNNTNETDLNYTLYDDSYQNFSLQDFNQSFMNDTSLDVSTELESTISVTEDSDTPLQNRELFLFLTPDEDICNCDLSESFCDVNCCCDQDCREEDLQIFSECAQQSLTPDENYCYQKDIILRNNTVYKMVRNLNNPMFCIVHDNFKHRLHYRDMPVLKSHRDVITVLNYKYKHTYSWDAKSANVYDSREPRAGNPIYISSKQNRTIPWSLPSPCLSDVCSCEERVRYLMDFRSSCSHVVADVESECESSDVLSGDRYAYFCVGRHSAAISSLTDLIAHTKLVDSKNSSGEADEYDSTLCVKNQIRPQKMSSVKRCDNVVRHIHYKVEQDGSNGITKIFTNFQYHNVSFGRHVMIRQSYSVDFVWSNTTEFERKSGNPGYQVGLPVLAATNGSDLNSDEMSKVFYKDGLTVLSGDSEGYCAKHRQTVKFGKNLRSGCILKFNNCKNLRSSIAEMLLGPNQRQIFVGIFGNANVSNSKDWIEVFHGTEDSTDDQDCSVSLGLQIHIIYAAVGTFANPQYKIVGVRYLYSRREAVDHSVAITLWTSVSFFDVTLPAVEHYAKVPSIKANLPGDFFYPFLYGQTTKTVSSEYLIFVLILCLCIF